MKSYLNTYGREEFFVADGTRGLYQYGFTYVPWLMIYFLINNYMVRFSIFSDSIDDLKRGQNKFSHLSKI